MYAANDGTAGGAISAMKAAGLDPVPPVTGQDAELAAIQRIVTGDQSMTVYKAISEQARTAAELAVRVVRGEVPVTTSRVQGVPALLLSPVPVTLDNVRRVIVDGGVYTTEEICVEPYTDACTAAGLLDGGRHDVATGPSSRCGGCPRATAPRAPSSTWTCRCTPTRWSPSSATTAPASPPSSAR